MVNRTDTLDVEAFKIFSSKSKMRVDEGHENIRVPIRARDRHTLLNPRSFLADWIDWRDAYESDWILLCSV